MTEPATASSGTAAASDSATTPDSATAPAAGKPGPSGTASAGTAPPPARHGYLASAALAWLVFALVLSRRTMTGSSGDFNLVFAVNMLPALVQASLVAGGASALWTTARLADRTRFSSGTGRVLLGVAAGLVAGAFASGTILIAYGVPAGGATVLASTVGLAGALGGGLCMIQPRRVLVAGVTATLAMIAVKYVISLFDNQLLGVFGAGENPAGDFAANGWLAFLTAAVAGLAAGIVAFWRLRRLDRTAGSGLSWLAYAAAGAAAGLMLILAELFTRLAAPWMFSFASHDVTGDQLFQSLAGNSRLNTGLVVLFVGTISAMIAIGRTLPPRRDGGA